MCVCFHSSTHAIVLSKYAVCRHMCGQFNLKQQKRESTQASTMRVLFILTLYALDSCHCVVYTPTADSHHDQLLN